MCTYIPCVPGVHCCRHGLNLGPWEEQLGRAPAYSLEIMCMSINMWMSVQIPTEASGAGAKSGLGALGAGNQIWVLYKRSKYSNALSQCVCVFACVRAFKLQQLVLSSWRLGLRDPIHVVQLGGKHQLAEPAHQLPCLFFI